MASSVTIDELSNERLREAVRANFIAFAGSGFAFASWAARIPQVRQHFHLEPSALGLVLLTIAGGSMVSLPLAGHFVARFGARRTVSAMAVLFAGGLATAATGYLAGLALMVAGLFVLGFANGAWDVAMNVEGAAIERRLGRSLLPRLHAGWSFGMVAGALVGAVMVAADVPVTVHFAAVAVVVAVAVPWQARRFISAPSATASAGEGGADAGLDEARGRGLLAAWREPRTLAIGLFVLAFGFAEGTGNDWISVGAINGYHVSAVVGTLAFAVFVAAMTAGRWFSPALLDHYGRVAVLRSLALTAIIGVALFVFGPGLAVAFFGVLLWGLGTSAGFPVGMSAGADDPHLAPARVSVIATVGYCAFLGGPPVIGFLGDHLTVLRSLTAVAALLALAELLVTSLGAPGAATTVRPSAPQFGNGQEAKTPTSSMSRRTRGRALHTRAVDP
jgi:MFS family permease